MPEQWVFINDLEINPEGRPTLFKYADDSTIIVHFGETASVALTWWISFLAGPAAIESSLAKRSILYSQERGMSRRFVLFVCVFFFLFV